jgi:hypothetical protein
MGRKLSLLIQAAVLPPYSEFAAGYSDTEQVELSMGEVGGDVLLG